MKTDNGDLNWIASYIRGIAGKAFGHEVMEGTMVQSEAGRSPAERGVGIVVLVLVTL